MSQTIEHEQTLIEHLADLRGVLIKSGIFIIIGMLICWGFSDKLMDIVRDPIQPFLPTGGLIFTGVMDKFIAHIKLAALGGVILSCPFWLYQIWTFIAPGLYQKERRYAIYFIFFGTFLFMLGVCFVYFLVYPMAFNFLMHFGGTTDKPMISIDEYLSFFTTTTLMFGLTFELPLVIVILAMIGIVDSKFLKTKRRYAIVILGLIAAIMTPPDVLSMLMMMVPMLLLYETSVWLVVLVERKRVEEQEV